MGRAGGAIIVEFNGCPGIGKSTVAQELERLAQIEGTPCYRSFSRSSFNKRAVSLLFSKELFYLFIPSLLFAFRFRSNKERFRYVLGLMMICRQYRHFLADKKCGVLVLDQGVVQDFISIAYADRIHGTKRGIIRIWKAIVKQGICFARVDCDAPEEKVFERLRTRKNGKSRIEKNDDSVVKDLLALQQENLCFVRDTLDQESGSIRISIDTNISPKENAELLWQFVYECSDRK